MLNRRNAVLGAVCAPAILRFGVAHAAGDPFGLGVASGSPSPDGFVLWTRIAPDPLAPDSGAPAGEVEVGYEIAMDEAMTRIVRSGRTRTSPVSAHALHLEVAGLQPNRPYWYRFTALGARSPVGRARTAPALTQRLESLRLVVASCAHWERGYFSAYRHMAAEEPDLTLFLGDYIYEFSYSGARAQPNVRRHDRDAEAYTLSDYRARYALYRTDPDLQALHAAAPCLTTWDDHEVQNDYGGVFSQFASVSQEEFGRRRAAAYQAFYEHMPLRRSTLGPGGAMKIFGRWRYGDLAEISVLDGRQYRSQQPCPTPGGSRRFRIVDEACVDRTSPDRSMLGVEQEAWLADGFGKASARWNLIAQNVLVAPLLQPMNNGRAGHGTDGWDGYAAGRGRMLQALARAKPRNPVFLGGDMHSFWATDLKASPDAPTLASEFVTTSISADGISGLEDPKALNPHVRFFDPSPGGYLMLEATPRAMTASLRKVSDRRDPAAAVSTLKRFIVADGRPGASEA